MEPDMDASGAFGELMCAVTARWGKISNRCDHPDHNCSVPCDLTALIFAIKSYPSVASGNGEPKRRVELRQLLDEFALFRRAVLEEAAEELARPLNADESVRLNGAVDSLSADGVERLVARHYRGIEHAVEGQNALLERIVHDVRGQLNALLLNLQLLERQISGETRATDSLTELAHLRRTILATIKQLEHPAPQPAVAQNR
jgi:signal transduction histidine kinase